MSKPSLHNFMNPRSQSRAMGVIDVAAWLAALTLVVSSAIWTKTNGAFPALVGIGHSAQVEIAQPTFIPLIEAEAAVELQPVVVAEVATKVVVGTQEEVQTEELIDPSYRYFDGKLVRPARVIYMTVTGYSPDARSCGKFADGKTATMYSVWTNGMNLVAADPKVLPYWSMVSVPGYAGSEIVPVLDCGGAIKGNRLDLLYPTHRLARKWGVRQIPITVWEFVETE